MALTELQLKPFADFIKRELGIVYEKQNYFQLEQRLEKIALAMGLGSASDVCAEQLKSGGIFGQMKTLLMDIATNNETQFFRDPKIFQAVENHILPNLRNQFKSATSFKIWSAASSFGQEPYSLAMLADEFLAKNPSHPNIEVMATDISDTALKRAGAAVYSQLEVQRGLSAARLVKYFDKKEDGSWALKSSIRNKVRFSKFNLLDPIPAGREVHILFCRYVLIYQEQSKKIEIVSRLVRAIQPGGYFVLGASESGLGINEALDQVQVDGCVFYRKKA
jgi:chemotaxis protein methyltransferase CheR